jgi:hypothetical protein
VQPGTRPLSGHEVMVPVHAGTARGTACVRAMARLGARATLVAAAVALSACATLGTADGSGGTDARGADGGGASSGGTAAAPVAETVDQELAAGIALYDKGEYVQAIRTLLTAQQIWSGPMETRVTAQKYVAFSHCLLNRPVPCKASFSDLLRLKPDFELAAAEAGHPQWGAAFLQAKQEAALQTATPVPEQPKQISKPAAKPTPKRASKRPARQSPR